MIKTLMWTLRANFYNLIRFVRHSSAIFGSRNAKHIQAQILIHTHALEKGLSLPQPRPGFGADRIKLLIKILENEIGFGAGISSVHSEQALRVLKQYVVFHSNTSIDTDWINNALAAISLALPDTAGGVRSIERDSVIIAAKSSFDMLTKSRHSTRCFLPSKVDVCSLVEAVEIAVRTPSVCNRQPWKVHSIMDSVVIGQILALQNGNRGFGEQIPCLLVVTGLLECFYSTSELNEVFVDGGMFSMTLLYALTFVDLATCPLNWCVSVQNDKKLRTLLPIEQSETVIMLIAVGHPPKTFNVAESVRKCVNEVLISH